MKFRYKKIAPKLIRPIIPITIQYKDNQPIDYEALVDSGADMCLLPAQIGVLCGVPVRKGKPGNVTGVTLL